MKIIIDIPKYVIDNISHAFIDDIEITKRAIDIILNAVTLGIELPEKYGRLIDADKLRAKFVEYRSIWDAKCLKPQDNNDYELGRWESYDFAVDEIDVAPTIVEANKS